MKERGFEIAKGFESFEISMPKRSTKYSAGYDFAVIDNYVIEAGQTVIAKTGIKAYMLEDEVLEIYIRSSLAIKRGIVLANSVGIIDADYYNNINNDGHIMIALTNITDQKVIIERHENVAQGIFKKYLTIDNEQQHLSTRTGGIGSTTKKEG